MSSWMDEWVRIRVTPSTLFKKRCYAGLSEEDAWAQALKDGWRFDIWKNKMYRMVYRGQSTQAREVVS